MELENYPLVTVITPCYNREEFIEETIQSVLSQNYPNFEYIVIDDGSTDNSLEIINKYSERVTWVSHPNIGETRTVNKGFNMAQGKYIGVLNSDDLLLPGAIQAAVETFQDDPEIIVAYPGWYYIDENSEFLYEEFVPEFNYIEMVRKHWCVVGPGAFINRRAFQVTPQRDENFRYVADFEYWLRLGLYGRFKRISGTYGTFRIHNSSASVQMKNHHMAKEHVDLMNKFFSLPGIPSELTNGFYYREAWGRAYLHAARTCSPFSRESLGYYLKSLKHYTPLIFLFLQDSIMYLLISAKSKFTNK